MVGGSLATKHNPTFQLSLLLTLTNRWTIMDHLPFYKAKYWKSWQNSSDHGKISPSCWLFVWLYTECRWTCICSKKTLREFWPSFKKAKKLSNMKPVYIINPLKCLYLSVNNFNFVVATKQIKRSIIQLLCSVKRKIVFCFADYNSNRVESVIIANN